MIKTGERPPYVESNMDAAQRGTAHPMEASPHSRERLRVAVRAHYAFLWRSLRRLGIPSADVDDAAQRVLAVFARRLRDVREGAERSFLFQTAMRVASETRRLRPRWNLSEGTLPCLKDPRPNPEEHLGKAEARQLLDAVLDKMPPDTRAVFVLFELEEMTTVEIAETLGIAQGTVSSRLRRGREEFSKEAANLRRRLEERL